MDLDDLAFLVTFWTSPSVKVSGAQSFGILQSGNTSFGLVGRRVQCKLPAKIAHALLRVQGFMAIEFNLNSCLLWLDKALTVVQSLLTPVERLQDFKCFIHFIRLCWFTICRISKLRSLIRGSQGSAWLKQLLRLGNWGGVIPRFFQPVRSKR